MGIANNAYGAVRNAEWNGTLVRPKRCEKCNANKRLFGHHHKGYASSHWLDVVWLCKPCHARTHKNHPKAADDRGYRRLIVSTTPQFHRRVKIEALKRRMTVGQFIEQAIRNNIAKFARENGAK